MRAAGEEWTHTEELLLQTCSLLDRQTRTIAALFGGKKAVRALGAPFEYRRPRDRTGDKRSILRRIAGAR